MYLGTSVPTLDGSSGRGMLCIQGARMAAALARALRLLNSPLMVVLLVIGLPHVPVLGDLARGVGSVQWSSIQIRLLTGTVELILRLSAAMVSGMLLFSWIMGSSLGTTARLRDKRLLSNERPRDDIVAGVIL